MDANFNRQIEREYGAVEQGKERFARQLAADKDKGREFDGPVGQKLTRNLMLQFVSAVEELHHVARTEIVRTMTAGGTRQPWYDHILTLDAASAAYITIRTCLSAPAGLKKLQLAKRVGRMFNLDLRFTMLREAEKARDKTTTEPPYNRLVYLLREVKQVNPRSVRQWLKKMNNIETTVWNEQEHAQLGLALVHLLIDKCSETFEIRKHKGLRFGRWVEEETVHLTEAAQRWLDASYRKHGEERPWLEPMVCPPLAWQVTETGWEGGYLHLPSDLFKVTSPMMHTKAAAADHGVPQRMLDAVNIVQRTAWRINKSVLDAVLFADEHRIEAVLPVEPRRTLPDMLPKEVWEGMSDEERSASRNIRRMIHDHNFRLESKRQAFRRQMQVAGDLRDEPEIFFPHNLDFRGRMYPLPQDLHPQADDVGKGLLMFAKAKPLGAEGYKWLQYHLANTYGCDKMNRAEQANWVVLHTHAIAAVAADPFGRGLDFWSKAEDKWQFLAAAIEYTAATLHDPHSYMSRLPVSVDGSCNGLQHLSAMGLDPAGSFATNLTTCEQRQDIYQIVADKVAEQVEADAKAGNEEARMWRGRVSRSVVKRGVMTVPYGLTPIGMRDQLIEDGWTDGMPDDRKQRAANYLRDRMREAIAGTVQAATEIMAWMQDNAGLLAKNGKKLRWVTPVDVVIQQSYYVPNYQRIVTVLGVGQKRRETVLASDGTELRVSKQVSSVVPNIIHSFDAAHLALTMTSLPSGISVSAVHDSFGTHASDMPVLLDTIREQFVEIYKQDWFTKLQQDFLACRETADFPLLPPPTRGSFDITAVSRAPFFFS